jgi:CDP-paratose synthetase
MQVIVTGATGFLGSSLVKALANSGHQVIILKRSTSDTGRLLHVLSRITAYDVDCTNIAEVFAKHSPIDAVIHTATCYGRKGESTSEILTANTLFPLKVLEAAVKHNVPLFINTDTVLDKQVNSYALSKKQFQEWGRQFAASGRIRFINLNLEHMYGPGDDESKFTTHVVNSCQKNVPELLLTLGEQKRDFIYIDDVVSAYMLLLKNAPQGRGAYLEFDVGSGQAISIREFVEIVHKLTNSQTKLCFGAVPYRTNEIMASNSNTDALKALGWKSATDLETGITACINEEVKNP